MDLAKILLYAYQQRLISVDHFQKISSLIESLPQEKVLEEIINQGYLSAEQVLKFEVQSAQTVILEKPASVFDQEDVAKTKMVEDLSLRTDLSESTTLKIQNIGKDRYQVVEVLGEGGMGIVERVQDTFLGRKVARKSVKLGQTQKIQKFSTKERTMYWRLKREAEFMAMLEHPNIVPLYDIQFEKGGKIQFTMREIQGETLGAFLKKKKEDVDENKILSIFFKICDAVSYAHSKGVIHRDLKPENIMLGNFGEVYVMDWGIGKWMEAFPEKEEMPVPTTLEKKNIPEPKVKTETSFEKKLKTVGGIGTIGYMAPEQQEDASQVTLQADIYALGKILRECFIGLSYYEEYLMKLEEGKNRLKQGIPTISDFEKNMEAAIPLGIRIIFEKATKEKPQDRYQTVKELVLDLEIYQKNLHVSLRDYLNFLLDIKEFDSTAHHLVLYLLQSLNDPNMYIRQDAAWTLGRMCSQPEQILPLLKESLQEKDFKNRLSATWVLGKLGESAQSVFPDILEKLKDPNKYVCKMAAWSLYQHPEVNFYTIPLLIESHKDKNAHNRLVSTFALAEIGPKAKDAILFLRELLKDENISVQMGAAFALTQIGSEIDLEMVSLLQKALTEENLHIRKYATKALENIKNKENKKI